VRALRRFASFLLEPATDHALAAGIFLKGLALVYAAAFASLAVQIDGLAGPQGILPFGTLLDRAWQVDGLAAVWHLPTLFWLGSGSLALRGAAWAGLALSLLLASGIGRPLPLLAALYVMYLSLYQAGQIFTSFQWDYLLLECGLLALFVAQSPARLAILMFEWLLFRLRFLSGVFKLASGDPSWRDLSAVPRYFETQPLPHAGAWYAHQLPVALQKAGTGFTLFAELVVPFFIFMPRPWRRAAAAITLLSQALIVATSNHNFINLLTILLCVFLLDDGLLRRWLPVRLRYGLPVPMHPAGVEWTRPALAALATLVFALSLTQLLPSASSRPLPRPLQAFNALAPAFGIGNRFHLFPTMQTERQELLIEGSRDGVTWKAYEFRYKPGALDRRPPFVVPHQPRLDWMMWFLPAQWEDTGDWFEPFLQALRENRAPVTDLLAVNPFRGQAPPRLIRVHVYRYRFTTAAQRERSGKWWSAEYLGEYPDVPPRRP
jgi:lipase maturation factor 1